MSRLTVQAPVTAADLSALAGLSPTTPRSCAAPGHGHWLIDKSALVRLGASPRARDWATRIERGLVATTATVVEPS